MKASMVAVARRFAFVRETDGPNAGAFVQFIQRFSHGAIGDSWCCQFVSLIEDIAYYGKPPLVRTGSCLVKLIDAQHRRYIVSEPLPNDLYFFVDRDGHPHHVGIVTGVAPLTGIAGNTSVDGHSDNGTGVFEHEIPAAGVVFARLP